MTPASQAAERVIPLAVRNRARLKCLHENRVVPGGLWLLFPLTQHSAFGYVLGFDIRAYGARFSAVALHSRNRNVVLTQTLNSCSDTKRSKLECFRSL
jgi:hypothetical protein